MRLLRRYKTTILVAGMFCSCLLIWKHWSFTDISMEDDYIIKISQDELEQLRRGRDADLDYDMEKIIKQKLQNHEQQAGLKEAQVLNFTLPPVKSSTLGLWRSSLFEQIVGTNVFFRSPTFDNRKRREVIRVLLVASTHDIPLLYCHVLMSHDPNQSLHLVTQAIISMSVSEENGVMQGEALCAWTSAQGPEVVTLSVSNSNATNHWHDIEYYVFKPPRDLKYGICLNTESVTHSDMESVLHWFDIQKLLGVSKVLMYGIPNLSKSGLDLLYHYRDKGFLDITDWQMPFETKDNGQYLANLDCLYKNMDAFTFLLYLDLGQYIVPHDMTMQDMLQYINTNMTKADLYAFQMNCFKSELEKIIFNGSVLNIKDTFKAELETMDKESSSHLSKTVAVRPQTVKEFQKILKNNDEDSFAAIVHTNVGSIIQYGTDECG